MRVLVVEDLEVLATARSGPGCAARAWPSTWSWTGTTRSSTSPSPGTTWWCSTGTCPACTATRSAGGSSPAGCDSRVLMLTAASTIRDRVDGLGLGRRRLPAQAVRLRRAGGPGPGAGPPLGRRPLPPVLVMRRPDPRPGPPDRVPGRAAARPQPEGVRRAGVPAGRRPAGWCPPRNCSNGSGTRRPTRSPPRSRRRSAGCGPSSATRRSSRPSARAGTGSEET